MGGLVVKKVSIAMRPALATNRLGIPTWTERR